MWLGVLAAILAGIWKLSELFPGRLNSDWDQATLIRLVLILALVSGSLVFARQFKFGEIARNLAIWAGVAVVLAIGFAFQSELKDVGQRLQSELLPGVPVASTSDIVVVTQSEDGHFYLVGSANGSTVRFLIDTGASDIVLSPSDARRIGIDMSSLNFTRRSETANGIGLGAPVTLQTLSVGPLELPNVRVVVNQADMGISLLGMPFLRQLHSFEFQGRRLLLRNR